MICSNGEPDSARGQKLCQESHGFKFARQSLIARTQPEVSRDLAFHTVLIA
jgi:hypothetical protein